MFIDEFLTPEFCAEHKLFTFQKNPKSDEYEIASREFEKIKQQLLFQLTNRGHPRIFVVDANYKNRGELYLWHRYEASEIQLAKSSSITLKAEFKTDRSADCGVTKYEQSIIIADGNTETILNPCVDFTSIPLCFGW